MTKTYHVHLRTSDGKHGGPVCGANAINAARPSDACLKGDSHLGDGKRLAHEGKLVTCPKCDRVERTRRNLVHQTVMVKSSTDKPMSAADRKVWDDHEKMVTRRRNTVPRATKLAPVPVRPETLEEAVVRTALAWLAEGIYRGGTRAEGKHMDAVYALRSARTGETPEQIRDTFPSSRTGRS